MPNRPILFSVAHSSAASGVYAVDELLSEYSVSLRASLAGEVPVELLDVGPFPQNVYDDLKVDAVNRCKPRLAIEIHCNGGPPGASYGEVIHHRASLPGAESAAVIARTLAPPP